jgi:DNA-directed RNA polymerase beta subunit
MATKEEEYEYDPDVQFLDEDISQEDVWPIITSYFELKGLVRQQLDSFDSFSAHTLMSVVRDQNPIRLRPEAQLSGHATSKAKYMSRHSF